MLMSLQSRAKRGAKLLDRVEPGWEKKIAVEKLDLDSDCGCPLGQLYGQLHLGLAKMGYRLETRDPWFTQLSNSLRACRWMFWYGFLAAQIQHRPALSEEWKAQVRARVAV